MTWKRYDDDYVHCPPNGEPVRVRFSDGREVIMVAWRDGDEHQHFSRPEDHAANVEFFEMVNPDDDREIDAGIAHYERTRSE